MRDRLAAAGWQMPLIENKGQNRFQFCRLPLRRVDGKVETDPDTRALRGWDRDRPVTADAGVHNLFQDLNGTGEPKDAKTRLEWRKRILEESDVFWNVMLPQLNVARATPAFRDLLGEYVHWLSEKSRDPKNEDASRDVWEKLLGRALELS